MAQVGLFPGGFATAAAGALAALTIQLFAAAPAVAAFKYLKPGMPATDFTLKAADGSEISLAKLKAVGPTLLVFWATWSPRSEPALRDLQGFAEHYAGKGLQVIAVNANRPDLGYQERALVDKTAAEWAGKLPLALDAGLAVTTAFGVVANPSVALLDGNGVLVHDASGWSKATAEACREQVEVLLGIRQPAAGAAGAAAPQARKPEHKALLSFNLGRTFLRQGNTAKGVQLLETAAAADPGWAAPRAMVGHIRLLEGSAASLGRAEELFREAVRLDPADVSSLSGLGEVLLRTGRVEEAAATLEKAHALDATYTPALTGRALSLARQGKAAEALALFEAALALNPRDPAVYAGRAECREVSGASAEAAADYRHAVEILLGAR